MEKLWTAISRISHWCSVKQSRLLFPPLFIEICESNTQKINKSTDKWNGSALLYTLCYSWKTNISEYISGRYSRPSAGDRRMRHQSSLHKQIQIEISCFVSCCGLLKFDRIRFAACCCWSYANIILALRWSREKNLLCYLFLFRNLILCLTE